MPRNNYALSYELSGQHSKDVKCLIALDDSRLVSGARDGKAILWTKNGNKSYDGIELLNTTSFINSVTYCPVNKLLFLGLQTGDIKVVGLDGNTGSEQFTLDRSDDEGGHRENVCCMVVDCKRTLLVSGSWDKTCKIWNILEKSVVFTLKEHQAAIWDVKIVEDDEESSNFGLPIVLTASADRTIMLWRNGEKERSFIGSSVYNLVCLSGHSDVVRSLFMISAADFLSAANDATIRRWNVRSGEQSHEYFGHENYIYCIKMMGDNSGCFVSGGEGGIVKVWEDGQESQSIDIPAHSVWAISLLANGDIACASSDGAIRIFSCDPDRQAGADLQSAYAESVEMFKNSTKKKEIAGVDINKLPGPEFLTNPGKKDGQTAMIRTGGDNVEIHQWDGGNQKWTKIGDALGDVKESEGKKTYLGKEYDFVFDVALDDGRPNMKLPYNISEDPWMSAQKYIWDNELPQSQLDLIANFIITNAPGAGTGANVGAGDPLTGSRYVPGSQVGNGDGNGMDGVDPLTGGGRYVPGSASGEVGGIGGGDPYTSSGRYVPGGSSAAPKDVTVAQSNKKADPIRPTGVDMPLRELKLFTDCSSAKLMLKLAELNGSAVPEGSRLQPDELSALGSILGNPEGIIDPQILKTLEKALYWPKDVEIFVNHLVKQLSGLLASGYPWKGFPEWRLFTSGSFKSIVPMLDLFRVSVLNRTAAEYFLAGDTLGPTILPNLCQLLEESQPASPPIQICVCRSIANAFKHSSQFLLISQNPTLENLVKLICVSLSSEKVAVQTASASALANIAFTLLHSKNGSKTQWRIQLLTKIVESLSDNVLYSLQPQPMFILMQIAARLKDLYSEDNGKTIARAIEIMLLAPVTLE